MREAVAAGGGSGRAPARGASRALGRAAAPRGRRASVLPSPMRLRAPAARSRRPPAAGDAARAPACSRARHARRGRPDRTPPPASRRATRRHPTPCAPPRAPRPSPPPWPRSRSRPRPRPPRSRRSSITSSPCGRRVSEVEKGGGGRAPGRGAAKRARALTPGPSLSTSSVSCAKPGFDPPICPTADGICQAPSPSVPLANYLAQVQARVAGYPNFFYFTAQVRERMVAVAWGERSDKQKKRPQSTPRPTSPPSSLPVQKLARAQGRSGMLLCV